ncbi:hypothetical protein V3C99_018009 [Haemonchus contortus]|uniref:Uncharacterized protein n=1 Tax=Haemonchus contortus TaxID=6289 RepID=A0A7I4Z5T6_HAECO
MSTSEEYAHFEKAPPTARGSPPRAVGGARMCSADPVPGPTHPILVPTSRGVFSGKTRSRDRQTNIHTYKQTHQTCGFYISRLVSLELWPQYHLD